jgi:hypothetical protein
MPANNIPTNLFITFLLWLTTELTYIDVGVTDPTVLMRRPVAFLVTGSAHTAHVGAL